MELSLIAASSAGWLTTTIAIIKAMLGLGFVIFVHELGHFLVAKACGVKCEKFYVGFDVPIKIGPLRLPAAIYKVQWGETEYGIGIIPLGGYVKMLGQDDNPLNAEQEAERTRLPAEQQDQSATDETEQPAAAEAAEMPAVAAEQPEPEQSDVGRQVDPRSFVAKSVPQRMAIISAGVIMNLIFAVIFATVAYKMGVQIMPCVIAGTSPGDPAWEQNFPSGSKIVQIGRDGEPDQNLRFTWELRYKVAESGIGSTIHPLDLLLQYPDESLHWHTISASPRLKDRLNVVSLGVRPPMASQLSNQLAVHRGTAAARSQPALAGGDVITAVNDIPLAQADGSESFLGHELLAALATRLDQPVVMTVQRAATGTVQQITVPPAPLMQLGLEMEIGPIVSIRKDSLAARAGFQVGDKLVSLEGAPIGDPVTLPQRLRALAGSALEFEVQRSTDELVTLTTDPLPLEVQVPYMGPLPVASIESLGIAYDVSSTVAAIEPGSSAAEAGLPVGSTILEVQFKVQGKENQDYAEAVFSSSYQQPVQLNEQGSNWLGVHRKLQRLLPNTEVLLTYSKLGTTGSITLATRPADDLYFSDRGLVLVGLSGIHMAGSLGEAISLGFRETAEKLTEVARVLKMLVTRDVSMDKLGGPITIVRVMGAEASIGFPRLLLFLTFLSANLAILNFLPIPALDGGHMVFLIIEAITGKPVDERVQGVLTLIGVLLLLLLMGYVIFNDILRI